MKKATYESFYGKCNVMNRHAWATGEQFYEVSYRDFRTNVHCAEDVDDAISYAYSRYVARTAH